MPKWLSLAVFIALTLGGGTLIGLGTLPGPWYEALQKPVFNPPDWLFGPAWTILYVLIAIAGWRVWQRQGPSALMAVWAVQLAINFLWSPIFFAAHSIGGALAIVLAMLVTIVVFITMAWTRDRTSAWLFMPYAAWVAFASLLNGAIFVLN